MKHLSALSLAIAILGGLLFVPTAARAQGTTFTYQGRLDFGGIPANGTYDVVASLYNTNIGGSTVQAPSTNFATLVTNGLFSITIDFGNVFFPGARWLELTIRTNGNGAFTTLLPRQTFTPAPYALRAHQANVLSGTVPASSVTGTIPLAQLPPTVLTNGSTFTGTFIGNGAGLTNLPAAISNVIATSTSVQMQPNVIYIATNNAGPVTFLLATNAAPGATTRVYGGGAGGWIVQPGASSGQTIVGYPFLGGIQGTVAELVYQGGGSWTPLNKLDAANLFGTINSSLGISGQNTLEFGVGLTKEANAGKIGYQVFTADALDIVGAGTSSSTRKMNFWAEGGSVFSGPVTATTVVSGGTIASPMWKATPQISTTGPLSVTNIFGTSGGTLIIYASGSGFSGVATTTIGMNVRLDGAIIDTASLFANVANTHLAFVPKATVKTGVAAGIHTIALTPLAGTSTDVNDRFQVTVMELPF